MTDYYERHHESVIEKLNDVDADVRERATEPLVDQHDGGVHQMPTSVTKELFDHLLIRAEQLEANDKTHSLEYARVLVLARCVGNHLVEDWDPFFNQ